MNLMHGIRGKKSRNGMYRIKQKNLEIGCMELGKKTLEIECMKWEFKSSIWMYGIGKFHNWTMDVWNWQKKKNSRNWMFEMGI